MKTLLTLSLLSIGVLPVCAQSSDENIATDTTVSISEEMYLSADFNNRTGTLEFLKALDEDQNINTSILSRYLEDLENNVIIFINHPLNSDNEELDDQTNAVVIHKENGKESGYLLEEKNVLFVLASYSEKGIRRASFKIKKQKSLFAQSFEDVKSLYSGLYEGSGAGPDGAPVKVRFVTLNSTKLKAPCLIDIDYPNRSKELSFKIHERSNFSFQVGVGASQVSLKNVSISNNELVVTLDSAGREEWKSNLNVFLTWHPGRDIDRFGPVWKQDLKKRNLKNKWLLYYTIKRMGVYTGFKLSKDPVENLHLGLNYAVTKSFFFNVGWAWTSVLNEGSTQIGDITTIEGAIDYVSREYDRNLYIGFSFMPGSVSKILGLNKED